jgi:hypothetical protein
VAQKRDIVGVLDGGKPADQRLHPEHLEQR